MKLTTGEINLGHATLLRHIHGGWAVPGGERISSKPAARDAASAIDGLMTERLLSRKLGSPGQTPAVTLTRRPAGPDAHRWMVAHA